jgi:hypothetical protein
MGYSADVTSAFSWVVTNCDNPNCVDLIRLDGASVCYGGMCSVPHWVFTNQSTCIDY